ncbi:hypothetical protein HNP72_000237 [Sphingobacterium soli]|nr:hypothetical protein [Sphingobacterium soli]
MNNDFIKNEVLVHSDTLLHYANKFTKEQNDAEDLLRDTLMKVCCIKISPAQIYISRIKSSLLLSKPYRSLDKYRNSEQL